MRITAPEYLILLGIGVLNIWAALILASVRARTQDDTMTPIHLEPAPIEMGQRVGSEQGA